MQEFLGTASEKGVGAELFVHQRRGIERALTRKRLLLIRPLGSGKTAIGLRIAAQLLHEPGSVGLRITPAHLLPQLLQEHQRWSLKYPVEIVHHIPSTVIPGTLYAMSYDHLRLSCTWVIRQKWKFLIVDEVHHAKNPQTQNHAVLRKLSGQTDFFIGMTGAPFQNSPYEFFHLVSLIAGKPLNTKLEKCLACKYERKYPFTVQWIRSLLGLRPQRGPIIGIRDPATLSSLLLPYVDYTSNQQCARECGLPEIVVQTVKVEMDASEVKVYHQLATRHCKKIDHQLLTDDLEETHVERAFNRVTDLRQALLETPKGTSSKVQALGKHVKQIIDTQPSAKILVFSNFVQHGVFAISRYLQTLGVPHAVYIGQAKIGTKTKTLEAFQHGRTPVLLLSPVGFEGLDLVGTTHVFIADPHYNPEVTAQLIARATRAGGRTKQIFVFHYLSCSNRLESGTIDEVIQRIAARKAKVNLAIQDLLESNTDTAQP